MVITGNSRSKSRYLRKLHWSEQYSDTGSRRAVSDIANLTFLNDQGKLVELSQFASISEDSGPSRLERKDKVSSLTVESQIVGLDLVSVGDEIQARVDGMDIPVSQ